MKERETEKMQEAHGAGTRSRRTQQRRAGQLFSRGGTWETREWHCAAELP